MEKRALYQGLWKMSITEKPMVFLSGPRQAGKTTFAKEIIAGQFKNKVYFNWDILSDKKTLIEDPLFFSRVNRVDSSSPLVILDEIHKYKSWRNYLKGIYDQFSGEYKFLVSGSGRLDLYQRGGDSLAGRYLEVHLFPFTLAELSGAGRNFEEFIKNPLTNFDRENANVTLSTWKTLFNLGGFPEPFLKGTKEFWTRWSQTYNRQIIRDDIRNISNLRDIDTVELLFSLLPSKIGNPVSINNIAGDLQVAFETVKNWLRVFDILYLTFHIAPWTNKISRAIVKEKKMYLFNYPLIQDPAARFENMVAIELYRAIYTWNEHGKGRFSLRYIRDKDKNEVDFLIVDNNRPVLLVETKLSDDTMAKNVVNFQNKLHIPAVQLVQKENVFKTLKNGQNDILIVTAHRWLSSLP